MSSHPSALHRGAASQAAEAEALLGRLLVLVDAAADAVAAGMSDKLLQLLQEREEIQHRLAPLFTRLSAPATAQHPAVQAAIRRLSDLARQIAERDQVLESAVRAARDEIARVLDEETVAPSISAYTSSAPRGGSRINLVR